MNQTEEVITDELLYELQEEIRWIARRLERNSDKLNRLHDKIDSLNARVGREARADRERDEEMSAAHDAIIAELAAATTERAGFLVLLKALKDGQGNPEKLEEIAQSVKSGRQEWVTAFDTGVAPPPAEPPPA